MLGKLVNGQLKYAGSKIKTEALLVLNPTNETLSMLGYKEVEHKHLKEKEGFYQVVDSYEEKSDKIIVNYKYEEIVEEEEM